MTKWLNEQELTTWIRLASLIELAPGVLEAQLKRDSDLSHFEYWVLAMLSEAPARTLRMSSLAARTRGTLPRLSHVVARLERRDLVERYQDPEDARVSLAHLTDAGWETVAQAAPGHVGAVREFFIDALTPEQLVALQEISEAMLARIAPGVLTQSPQPREEQGGPS